MRAFTSTVEIASTLPMAAISSGTSPATAGITRTETGGRAASCPAPLVVEQDTAVTARITAIRARIRVRISLVSLYFF